MVMDHRVDGGGRPGVLILLAVLDLPIPPACHYRTGDLARGTSTISGRAAICRPTSERDPLAHHEPRHGSIGRPACQPATGRSAQRRHACTAPTAVGPYRHEQSRFRSADGGAEKTTHRGRSPASPAATLPVGVNQAAGAQPGRENRWRVAALSSPMGWDGCLAWLLGLSFLPLSTRDGIMGGGNGGRR